MKNLRQAVCLAVLAVLMVAACHDKGTLEGSRVEYVRVDGRRFEVRVAPADAEGEFRMLVVRATIVLNPNAEAERSRAENVAKPFMTRSCGGQSYKVLEDLLIDSVTLSLRFRCLV
ncbi:MAG: hypothetical protein ACXWLB_04930 [Reyranella sp.]